MGLFGSGKGGKGLLDPKNFAAFINGLPEESDYALIGKIALQQTGLEYQIERMIWYYMKDIDIGHIVTSQMQNRERADLLRVLVEWREPDDDVAEAIEWMLKAFDILRVNRNSVIHGFNFSADRKANKLTIERRTKSRIFDAFEVFEINRAVLDQVRAEQSALAMYLWALDRNIQARPRKTIGPPFLPQSERAQLPSKPPLPTPLTPLPHQAPKSERTLRRERDAIIAKQSKADRKARQRADPKNRQKGKQS